MEHQGLVGRNETQIVLFGGGSSGGIGAMYHLDRFADLLKNHNVKIDGYLDGPLDFDNLNSDPKNFMGLNH